MGTVDDMVQSQVHNIEKATPTATRRVELVNQPFVVGLGFSVPIQS
jgi:hypothetical protein